MRVPGYDSTDLRRLPRPQSPACDDCTVGVMDAGNPHLWGECDCPCHTENRRYGPGNPDWEHDAARLERASEDGAG